MIESRICFADGKMSAKQIRLFYLEFGVNFLDCFIASLRQAYAVEI